MAVSHIPEGMHSINAAITVTNAREAIAFYETVFDGKELSESRLLGPGGSIMHTQVRIGDSNIMLSDPMPQWDVNPPEPGKYAGIRLFVYVPDVDATVAKAVAAGGELVDGPRDEFYGHRSAKVLDPFGHTWSVGQVLEVLNGEQMRKRFEAMMANSASA